MALEWIPGWATLASTLVSSSVHEHHILQGLEEG